MNLKSWVAQVRYPYSAGILAIVWIGSAIIATITPNLSVILLLTSLIVMSLAIAIIGFAPSR